MINSSLTVRSVRRRYYSITFLVWLATALPLSLSVLLAQARGIGLAEVGLALGIYSLTVVALEVPTGGLADAVGRKRVALVAFALAALYNLAFLFAFSFPTLLLAMILYGVSRALSSGALDAWFVDALLATDPDTDLQPALAGAENAAVEVAAAPIARGAVKLVGNVAGSAPFKGVLRHPGWATTRIELPAAATGQDPLVIAPAEVELS